MWRTLCAVLVIFALWSPVGAVQLSDATQHFSFDIPPDWQPISPTEIDAVRGPGSQGLLAGARSKDTGVPYCVVQAVSKPPGDPAGYVDKFRLDAIGSGMTVTSGVYDTRRQAVILQAQHRLPTGIVNVTTYAFVGKNAVICINCYDFEAGFSKSMPTFEALADSFRFDPGYGYGNGNSFPSLGTIVDICIGIILIALYPLIRRSMRSKTQNKTPSLLGGSRDRKSSE